MAGRGNRRGVPIRMGALTVLAIFFVVSALIRVGDVVAALPGSGKSSEMVNQPAGKEAKEAETGPDKGTRGPTEVLAELKRQRALLDAREAGLAEREQQLNALKIRLKDRLEELKTERNRLAETAALVDDAAGKDVRRLAQMYGQMKPKQAALIFDRMAPSFASGFLSEMRPEAAALILQNMQPERAYAVSLMLAGRNVDKSSPTPSDKSPTE